MGFQQTFRCKWINLNMVFLNNCKFLFALLVNSWEIQTYLLTQKMKLKEHNARFQMINFHFLWKTIFKCFLKPLF